MELLFLTHSVRVELIIFIISGAIIALIYMFHIWAFFRQVREIFWPKKRDAIMSKRDTDLLKKRSQEEEDEELPEIIETPPPIQLEELGDVEAVDPTIFEEKDQTEDLETQTVSGDSEVSEPLTETITPETETEEETEAQVEVEAETEIELTEDTDTQNEAIQETEVPVLTKTNEEVPNKPKQTKKQTKETPVVKKAHVPELENTQQEETLPPPKKEHTEHIESLLEITNQAKTLFARGNITEARAAITSGLALDKNHRDLNLLLGEIYESEKRYPQAEIVYKDLAFTYPEDQEILERLANTLIILKNYTVAYEIYKKIADIGGNTENTLFVLVNIAYELKEYEEVYTYAKLYLKSWPTNKDILALMAEAEIELGKRKDAIQTLIKLKNLSPYDAGAITDMIAKLVAEEELAENFGDTTHS